MLEVKVIGAGLAGCEAAWQLAERGIHVTERRHLVALGDVIRVAGDENDLNGVVALPQPFGHGDPIHAAHFDVQQQNIKVAFLGIVEKKPLGGGKGFYMCRAIPFGGPTPDQGSDIVPIRLGIVTNCNFVGQDRKSVV